MGRIFRQSQYRLPTLFLLKYDAAGNLEYDGRYKFTYDAWNRLVKVEHAYRDALQTEGYSVGSILATMAYDGLGRRTVKAISNSADLDCTYHYYYDGQSIIEIRNGSDFWVQEFTWGLQYIDELCQIRVRDIPDESETEISTYVVLQDANFNVLGLIETTLAAFNITPLVERYEYTPYGQRTVYRSAGSNDPWVHSPTLLSRRMDKNAASFGTMPWGINPIGHQGLFHDEEFGTRGGLIYNRARMLHPTLGRFMQRDPLEYFDNMNVYQYVSSRPTRYYDPYGKSFWDTYNKAMAYVLCAVRVKREENNKVTAPANYPGGADKYNHCRVACEVDKQCGGLTSWAAGVANEIIDNSTTGFSWEDLAANKNGRKIASAGGDCTEGCKDPCKKGRKMSAGEKELIQKAIGRAMDRAF